MDYYDVRRLALVLAVQAEIEAMKAENQYRQVMEHEPTYSKEAFEEKSLDLKNLAYAHNDQL